MTTKTTITLSPIKRCYTSPHLKKRRMTSILINRNHMISSSARITISHEKQNLPDLVKDILIEQQRRKNVSNIATILRKVGDQIDEQLQIDHTSNDIFGQGTITFVYCFTHILRFFL